MESFICHGWLCWATMLTVAQWSVMDLLKGLIRCPATTIFRVSAQHDIQNF